MHLQVYVTAAGDDHVARFQMDARTGALELRAGLALSGRPAPIAVHPDRRRLFVARRGSCELSTLRIDAASGALTLAGTVPLESDPCYLAVDRGGRFVLSAYYKAARAAVHRLGDDGTPEVPPVEWLHTGVGSHCFQTDPANRFGFVPHIAAGEGANAIFQFRFDAASGRLKPNEPPRVSPPAPDGPRHLCFHPHLDLLYCSNEQGCSVTAYRLGAAGTLAPVQTVSTLPAGWTGENTCSQIRITPDGRFLYAPNRGHDSIAAFTVEAGSGRLSALGHSPAEPVPRAFDIDPDGRFLLSAGLESGRLACYRIDADTGALERYATHEVGAQPMWVAIL